MERKNLFEYICIALYTAAHSYPGLNGAQNGIDDFLDHTAEAYVKQCYYINQGKAYDEEWYKEHEEQFAHALYDILTIVPIVSSDITIRLHRSENPTGFSTVDGTQWNFEGMFPSDKGKYTEISWALEETDWSQWLGMDVSEEFWIQAYPDVLAAVIWEMTWGMESYIPESERESACGDLDEDDELLGPELDDEGHFINVDTFLDQDAKLSQYPNEEGE